MQKRMPKSYSACQETPVTGFSTPEVQAELVCSTVVGPVQGKSLLMAVVDPHHS